MATFTFKADAVADGAMKSFEHGKQLILIVRAEGTLQRLRCGVPACRCGSGQRRAVRRTPDLPVASCDLRCSQRHPAGAVGDRGTDRYKLHRDGKRWVVDLDAVVSPAKPPALARGQHVVIVGAGRGGFMAAHTLRQHGFAGRLTLVDPDHAAPYERPMLSKMFLNGKVGAGEQALGGKHWEKNHRITRRYSRAVGVKPGKHQLLMERGNPLDYDHLIVATGAQPRTADLPGANLAGGIRGLTGQRLQGRPRHRARPIDACCPIVAA